MPKKKLTKRQVKSKLKTLKNVAYDLALDRMGHGTDSLVPISFRKLNQDILNVATRAFNKV
jgi:hypothetical protein|tara:strand:- start:60 stop:242 length:183 start_codon:yes stop_codon:yes gene_type:complete